MARNVQRVLVNDCIDICLVAKLYKLSIFDWYLLIVMSFYLGPCLLVFPGHTAPDQLMSDLILAQEQHSAQVQYDLKEEVQFIRGRCRFSEKERGRE